MSKLIGRRMRYRNLIGGIAAAMLLCAQAQAAPAAPQGNDAIYMYRGADRDRQLVDKAAQEGKVVIYTSLATKESTPLASAFEKKYGIKVELWRANSDQVVQRAITEGKGKRYTVDVMETNGPEVEMMAREKLLSEFYTPYLADLPASAIAPSRLWVSDRLNFFVVAFNTNKYKRSDMPATYDGFLDPKWKGQIGIEATDTEWMAAVIKKMGTEKGMQFFQKLAAMRPDMRKGHILLASMVGAGEVPVALTLYNAEVESLKRTGQPIDWVPVDPVVGRPQGIGVAKNAPHPYAALLFADYVLSPEGQALLASMGRVPSSHKIKTALNDFPFVMAYPDVVLDENDKWQKLWDSLFMAR
ncbi:MAG: futA [Herbaspirillum sp.]|jgi:iron(III) transport system substrate-binding protein|nr:futA [Herbaspirillum sp.]